MPPQQKGRGRYRGGKYGRGHGKGRGKLGKGSREGADEGAAAPAHSRASGAGTTEDTAGTTTPAKQFSVEIAPPKSLTTHTPANEQAAARHRRLADRQRAKAPIAYKKGAWVAQQRPPGVPMPKLALGPAKAPPRPLGLAAMPPRRPFPRPITPTVHGRTDVKRAPAGGRSAKVFPLQNKAAAIAVPPARASWRRNETPWFRGDREDWQAASSSSTPVQQSQHDAVPPKRPRPKLTPRAEAKTGSTRAVLKARVAGPPPPRGSIALELPARDPGVGNLHLDLTLRDALILTNLDPNSAEANVFREHRRQFAAAKASVRIHRMKAENPPEGKPGYIWRDNKGHHYRTKVSKSNGINGNLSLESVLEYVYTNPETMPVHDPVDEIPYSSIADLISTSRKASENGIHFRWPSGSLQVHKVISHALHMLPPGGMLQIKSSAELPSRYYTAAGRLREDIQDLYHGTHAHAIPDILSQGLRASISGAGSGSCKEHYGVHVPMTYMAFGYDVALRYPIDPTTMGFPGAKTGIAGASLVANDHTQPLRAVVRCVALPGSQIWRRGDNQLGYKPDDLHITHVAFYAAPALHVHKHHMIQEIRSRESPNELAEDLRMCCYMTAPSQPLTDHVHKRVETHPESLGSMRAEYVVAHTLTQEPTRVHQDAMTRRLNEPRPNDLLRTARFGRKDQVRVYTGSLFEAPAGEGLDSDTLAEMVALLPAGSVAGFDNPKVALSVPYHVAEQERDPASQRHDMTAVLQNLTMTPDGGPLVRETHRASEAATYTGSGELVTEAQPRQAAAVPVHKPGGSVRALKRRRQNQSMTVADRAAASDKSEAFYMRWAWQITTKLPDGTDYGKLYHGMWKYPPPGQHYKTGDLIGLVGPDDTELTTEEIDAREEAQAQRRDAVTREVLQQNEENIADLGERLLEQLQPQEVDDVTAEETFRELGWQALNQQEFSCTARLTPTRQPKMTETALSTGSFGSIKREKVNPKGPFIGAGIGSLEKSSPETISKLFDSFGYALLARAAGVPEEEIQRLAHTHRPVIPIQQKWKWKALWDVQRLMLGRDSLEVQLQTVPRLDEAMAHQHFTPGEVQPGTIRSGTEGKTYNVSDAEGRDVTASLEDQELGVATEAFLRRYEKARSATAARQAEDAADTDEVPASSTDSSMPPAPTFDARAGISEEMSSNILEGIEPAASAACAAGSSDQAPGDADQLEGEQDQTLHESDVQAGTDSEVDFGRPESPASPQEDL